MNKLIKIIFFSLIMMLFACSDDKASSMQEAPEAETKAASEATMEEESAMDSMEVPPWASLEQEVIYNTGE